MEAKSPAADAPAGPNSPEPTPAAPSFNTLLAVFGKIGLLSFGGPAAQIALMHRELVDEHRWLDERRFLSGLSFCMLLPGPEAMQLATYAGWRLHGVKGGLAAGLLFVLPGSLLVLTLSILYGAYGSTPTVAALFVGVKAAVLAIVLQALVRVANRAIKGNLDWATAIAAFVAIFFLNIPFPFVIAAAAAAGYFLRPLAVAPSAEPVPAVPLAQTLSTLCIWLAVWIVPLLAIVAVFGPQHVLSKLAWYFSQLGVITFGGAYAMLAYMAQVVVSHYGWLTPGEMLDGLGLAETTNGPLILVTEFVGYMAGLHAGGVGIALLSALVTLWSIFAPCFLFIFVGAPYIEHLTHAPRLSSALQSVTAAVVGVIANLSLWFALHVLFAKVDELHLGLVRFFTPELGSLDLVALRIAGIAMVLIFWLRRSIVETLGVCVAAALVWRALG